MGLKAKSGQVCVLPLGAPSARSFLKIIISSNFSAVFANSAVNEKTNPISESKTLTAPDSGGKGKVAISLAKSSYFPIRIHRTGTLKSS
jgi:hypothetical protein